VKLLDKKTSLDLTKLVVFMVVTTIATGVLVVTIGNLTFSGASTY
jgi:phospholipid/cholesterol/gamma-HCH transport system substrate-binding protein